MAKVKLSAVGLYTLCIELTEAGRRNYTVAGAPGGLDRDAAAEGDGDIGKPFAPAASLGCKMAPAWEVSIRAARIFASQRRAEIYPLRFLASAASTAGSLPRTINMRLFEVEAKSPPWPTWA
jgi:hypothetical protein